MLDFGLNFYGQLPRHAAAPINDWAVEPFVSKWLF